MKIKEKASKRFRIKTVSNLSIALTLVLMTLSLIFAAIGTKQYKTLIESGDKYVACENSIVQLRVASDEMTRYARLAVSECSKDHIDAYFKETDIDKNREEAVSNFKKHQVDTAVVASLETALNASDKLMELEWYAMRLVENALSVSPDALPEKLKSVTLSDEDASLSKEACVEKARTFMMGSEYENGKLLVYQSLDECLSLLRDVIFKEQKHAGCIFGDIYNNMIICIGIFSLMILALFLITRFCVVNPLLKYNENIQHGPIRKLDGIKELQTLGITFNQVYYENEEKQKTIQYQAEHDYLTDLLNRRSFDDALRIYRKNHTGFALVMIDVDDFKNINDTYGHDSGDRVLKGIGNVLLSSISDQDMAFRIGGDEFCMILTGWTKENLNDITDKMNGINAKLSEGIENVPQVSISFGLRFVDGNEEDDTVFKDADDALYDSKDAKKSIEKKL